MSVSDPLERSVDSLWLYLDEKRVARAPDERLAAAALHTRNQLLAAAGHR